MIVVSDTSPVSHLFKINQLHLLEQLFGKVVLPNAVWEELLKLELDFGFDLSNLKNQPWLETHETTGKDMVNSLADRLDIGESEAIVLALELKADTLLMDEMKGRTVAKEKGISTIGVLGIVLLAKQKGFIPAAKPVLDDLLSKAGAWISNSLYQQPLVAAGETI